MDDGPIKIIIDFDNKKYVINQKSICFVASNIMTMLGVGNFELSILFTDNTKIKELNSQYREKDKATDVLSFPQSAFENPLVVISETENQIKVNPLDSLLGDLAISVEYTETNAKNIGQSINDEMCFLMIHGILHLCGHDHIKKEEEQKMLVQQKILTAQIKKLFSEDNLPLMIKSIDKGSK